jgi:hypothetical protein
MQIRRKRVLFGGESFRKIKMGERVREVREGMVKRLPKSDMSKISREKIYFLVK